MRNRTTDAVQYELRHQKNSFIQGLSPIFLPFMHLYIILLSFIYYIAFIYITRQLYH